MVDDIKVKSDADKAIRRAAKEQKKAEKKKQVLAFAKDTLGCGKKQAKVLRKVAGKFLTMADDGLRFKGMGGKMVAVDDPQCKDFFKQEYSFLLPPQETTLDQGALDPADIALARSGNMTAKGRCLLALNGDEAALMAALADKGNLTDSRDKSKALDKSKSATNPFIGLRGKDGKINPEQMKKVQSFIKAAGSRAAADVARSAGLRLDGSEIPEQYR